ncbi:hypothetical protein OROGR_025730 [Orobanche gracilis]
MEALLCRNLGDPTAPLDGTENTALTVFTTHPIPQLITPTAVRVRVRSTSLNFANYLQILGKYQEKPPLPFIPGSDYSGTVDAVGPGVTKFKIGDPVCSFAAIGSFAQFIVADESEFGGKLHTILIIIIIIIIIVGVVVVVIIIIIIIIIIIVGVGVMKIIVFLVPEECDLLAAGALPVAYGTSHVALVHRAQLQAGQVLLVLGAAGGVGVSAVQIGKICGSIVIAVARGVEKVQFLKSLGVDHVVDLSKENILESVGGFLKARKLKGIDVLYDPVGGKLTKDSLKLLNWGAEILVIGFASGEVPIIPANIALVKNWTIHGLYWGSYKTYKPHVLSDSLKELLSWLARGLIKIQISHTFTLSQSNRAFAALKDRKAIGKVLIAFDDDQRAAVRSNL